MRQSIDEIKKNYPDEWLILGDPEMSQDGQRVLNATLLYHGTDKRKLAYMEKPLLKTCSTSALLFNRVTVRKKSVMVGGRAIGTITPKRNADEILL
ncbi:hypothetical protein FACS1894195_0670 [Bacteroidia bacterium]|nr:hypothetical protein FACS1894195_0670 [Bacteroidia bacterium]